MSVPAPAPSTNAPKVCWMEAEKAIFIEHLHQFRGFSRNDRYTLIMTVVLPKVKLLHPGILQAEWDIHKRVSHDYLCICLSPANPRL